MAGLAAAFNLDPLDKRWTGKDYSTDEPWYITRVRGWLAMFRQIMEGVPGSKASEQYKTLLEERLETEPPSLLYEFYKEWIDVLRAESDSKKNKQ